MNTIRNTFFKFRSSYFKITLRSSTALTPKSATQSAAVETHTGQKFAADDFEVSRFTLSEKLVNRNFAQKLISEVAPIPCQEHIVSCDGGGGALGHPKVYINLDKPGNHTCGYCGIRYYLEDKTI